MSKFIGDVSAYAYAVSKGYTGTEEEFAELMASYADVGQTAVDAKDAAVAAKTAAETAANTATNKASEASTSAQTATTKAVEAQQSATTATTKAQEASQSASESSQSASTAVHAKTDAETAKQASETAQRLAESARDGAAQSASEAAASASQAAESARTLTIDSTPTQGSTNAVSSGGVWDKITDLKADFNGISGSTDNIFDMSVFDGVEGITKETNGSYTGTALAFNNAFAHGVPGLTFEANKQYFLSFLAYTDGNQGTEANNGLQFSFYKSDNTRIGRKSVLNSQTTEALFTVFSTARNTVSHMTIGYSGNAYNIWHIRNIMLCVSSMPVDYIPHVTANDSVARNKVKDSIFITDISGDKILGAYINLQRKVVGDTVDLTPTANTSMSYAIEECNAGDAYIITTTGLSAGLPYAFIDANNVITEIRNIDPLNIAEYSVIAPTDGKLIVNSVNNATFSLIKVTNAQTAEKINEAQFLRTLSPSIRWKGKRIVTFGDSRTWYDGHLYTENAKSELQGSVCVGYQEQMRKLMMAQVENQGASGETSAQICTRIRAFDFTGYDAVFLEGGVNDFVKSSQVTVGELAPIGSAFDTTTIYGAWQSAVEHILTNYPSVLIYMDIPAIAWTSAGLFPYSTAKIKGEIAELYNLPCLDLYKKSGINEVNRDYWYCDDVSKTNWRLHFNDYGNALIGQKIAGFLSTH